MARFMVHAYIRDDTGSLVESVSLDVCAANVDSAHSMVKWYYKQKNLTAGINTDATVEMKDFAYLVGALYI